MNTNNTTAAPVTPLQKGDTLTIIGRRWFDRINGNTYHSATAVINGKETIYVPFAYGYETQYIYTAANKLHEKGFLPGFDSSTVLWRYCEENGITLHTYHSDVRRKKDL